MEHKFSIVLHAPDIPGNTGSIGRTCVALNLRLILIKPYGFEINKKAVRRAGLDYWKQLNLVEYESFSDFLKTETPDNNNMFFFSKSSEKVFYEGNYSNNCYLIFGSETKGLPQQFFKEYSNRFYKLPMYSPHIRSLNLSNVATTVAFEALRHISFK